MKKLLMLVGIWLCMVGGTQAQGPPPVVPFSGVVTDEFGQPQTGLVAITFSIYLEPSGFVAPLWVEIQAVELNAQGGYSVLLGVYSPGGIPLDLFATGAARWLGVQVDSDSEQPRVPFTSVPYALKAAEADTLGGLPASAFVLISGYIAGNALTAAESSTPSSNLTTVLAAQVINDDLDVTGNLTVQGTGPHAIGVATESDVQLGIGGVWIPSGNSAGADMPVRFSTTTVIQPGRQAYGVWYTPGFNPAASGNHFLISSLRIEKPAINAGAATVSNTAAVYISSAAAAGSNNYALWVDAGDSRVDGNLQVGGDLTVSGNIAAKYQDVAEWVDASEDLVPGTVVVIDVGKYNHVRASSAAYDTGVAGAVSPQPGLTLGEPGEGRVLVAQSGRVRIKADASYGAIVPGDLLVTSPTPGHAMRSAAMQVGEAAFHRPGTVLGKALEPLEDGLGEVLVLLTLQ